MIRRGLFAALFTAALLVMGGCDWGNSRAVDLATWNTWQSKFNASSLEVPSEAVKVSHECQGAIDDSVDLPTYRINVIVVTDQREAEYLTKRWVGLLQSNKFESLDEGGDDVLFGGRSERSKRDVWGVVRESTVSRDERKKVEFELLYYPNECLS